MISFDAVNSAFYHWDTDPSHPHVVGSGNNRMLIVGILVGATVDAVTSVTWKGQALTRMGTYLSANENTVYLYGLLNPTSGSDNVEVVLTLGYDSYIVSQSYAGVLQSSQPDDYDSNSSGSATSITTASTVVTPGSWLISFAMGLGDSPTPPVAGSGTTRRGAITIFSGGDSNGALSPGNNNSVWQTTSAGVWDVVQMSIKPALTGRTKIVNFL